MADAELDLGQQPSSDPDDTPRAAAADHAPQCAGCHRRGVALLLLQNGKRYCDRCAHEVERLMGIGPLVPGAELIADDSPDTAALSELAAAPDAADIERPDAATGEPASEAEHSESDEDTPTRPSISIDRSAAAALGVRAIDDPAGVDQATGADGSSEAAPDEVGGDDSNLTTLVSRANREAAQSSASRISQPQLTTAISIEEPPLMERVHEQTRPAASIGALSSDLLGALSAERARLLEQREVLEARFRTETQSIDERLLHVESLLGDEHESLAS